MTSKLIFVYNADSGLFNALTDSAHKLLSPKTYSCNLCAITYGAFSMNKDWKEFLDELEFPLEFLHRNEWEKQYGNNDAELPAVFLDQDAKLENFLTAQEINNCKNVDDLKQVISEKLGEKS